MMTREMSDPIALDGLRAYIECQQPTVNLYQFIGKLTVYSSNQPQPATPRASVKSEALGVDNLLLRGSRLKDTDFIYGNYFYSRSNNKLQHLISYCILFCCLRHNFIFIFKDALFTQAKIQN